jgi:hypothetical protein
MQRKKLESCHNLEKITGIIRSINCLENAAIECGIKKEKNDYQHQAMVMQSLLMDVASLHLNFFHSYSIEEINEAIAKGGWDCWKLKVDGIEGENSTMPMKKLVIVEA